MQGIPAILVHGGAGRAVPELERQRTAGLLAAVRRGWDAIGEGALEAVVAAVAVLEGDEVFNAGRGSVLNSEGIVEMDASVMEGGGLAVGAVAAVSGVRHPIQLSRALLDRGEHVFLAGDAARRRAAEWGLEICEPGELVTPRQRDRWLTARAAEEGSTVGAVAIDARGRIAAATSTGGTFMKWPGRVGDSAVIGAGTYADDRSGAASATGHGESILRLSLARYATSLLGSALDPRRAAEQAVAELARRTGGEGGLILVDALGRLGWATNAAHMPVAWRCGTGEEDCSAD